MAALFVIVLAATESVVALALILNIYKHFKTIHLSDINQLKG
jgi:NADH-quinone oxidoreductase subunit K